MMQCVFRFLSPAKLLETKGQEDQDQHSGYISFGFPAMKQKSMWDCRFQSSPLNHQQRTCCSKSRVITSDLLF